MGFEVSICASSVQKSVQAFHAPPEDQVLAHLIYLIQKCPRRSAIPCTLPYSRIHSAQKEDERCFKSKGASKFFQRAKTLNVPAGTIATAHINATRALEEETIVLPKRLF